MASFLLTLPSLPTPPPSFKAPPAPPRPPIRFSVPPSLWKTRGSTVLTHAGPSAAAYAFAFGLPLSLIAGTVITSLKVAEDLEKEYIEEQAINRLIEEAMEADDGDDGYEDDDDDDDDDDTDDSLFKEKELEPALPPSRNRPKREV